MMKLVIVLCVVVFASVPNATFGLTITGIGCNDATVNDKGWDEIVDLAKNAKVDINECIALVPEKSELPTPSPCGQASAPTVNPYAPAKQCIEEKIAKCQASKNSINSDSSVVVEYINAKPILTYT